MNIDTIIIVPASLRQEINNIISNELSGILSDDEPLTGKLFSFSDYALQVTPSHYLAVPSFTPEEFTNITLQLAQFPQVVVENYDADDKPIRPAQLISELGLFQRSYPSA